MDTDNCFNRIFIRWLKDKGMYRFTLNTIEKEWGVYDELNTCKYIKRFNNLSTSDSLKFEHYLRFIKFRVDNAIMSNDIKLDLVKYFPFFYHILYTFLSKSEKYKVFGCKESDNFHELALEAYASMLLIDLALYVIPKVSCLSPNIFIYSELRYLLQNIPSRFPIDKLENKVIREKLKEYCELAEIDPQKIQLEKEFYVF